MRQKVLLLFLVLGTARIYAQDQRFIQVRDANSRQILQGATISCAGEEGSVQDAGFVATMRSESCEIKFEGYESVVLPSGSDDSVVVYLEPSTRILASVTVRGFQEKAPLTAIAGGYGYLNSRELEAFGEFSPLPAFNSVPGVRMEQRSPGSYRFNLRGSTLRSPFGVRNVKIYLNDIPFTEPTGSTPFNMLDLQAVNAAEIIRGPAGSTYGAGVGGVIMLGNTFPEIPGTYVTGTISGGSFGLMNGSIHAENRSDKHAVSITGSILKNNGYREHSEAARKNLSLIGEISLSEVSRLGYQLFFTQMGYELPGGLTEEQRDSDPTAAREIAITQNSRLDQDYLVSGLSYNYSGATDQLLLAAFFSSSDKENPFITNYEFEDLGGGGVRARYQKTWRASSGLWKLTGGGEWQWGIQKARNFGNSQGYPDSLRYADRNNQFTGFEYLQLSYDLEHWRFTAGASINHLDYEFNREKDVAQNTGYRVNRLFSPVVSPRFAMVRKLGNWSAHASYSVGFSPPTLDEIRTSDGAINDELKAEKGHNLEAGVRGNFLEERLMIDLTAFQLWQRNTIVGQVGPGGISTFNNSGSTSQRGIEFLAGYQLVSKTAGFFRSVYLRTSLTLNHFRFTDYIKSAGSENVDYSGNKLTGAPAVMQSAVVHSRMGKGWNAEIRYQYVDRIPLNDANSVYSRAYHLLQAKVEWKKPVGQTSSFRIFAGADNLLNREYSLGNDLNAFGGRYFNPAATINAWGGVGFSFFQN